MSLALAGRRCVVVGGAGAVGGMFVELLLHAGADVCVVDSRRPVVDGCAFERGDITALTPPVELELRRADTVVLAVPEQVALAVAGGVARVLRPGALLADTLSVKSRVVALLTEHTEHIEALSVNPMFAPSLGIDGRPVAAVIVRGGPRTQELLSALRAAGAHVVRVDAQRHDELAAVTQALTHAAVLAFGLALSDLDVDVGELGELAPPPHLTLLALLARIASGQSETYWDIQSANPYAPRARAALAAGVRRLADVIDSGDEGRFADLLADLDLGSDASHYGELCAELFTAIRPPDRTALASARAKGDPDDDDH